MSDLAKEGGGSKQKAKDKAYLHEPAFKAERSNKRKKRNFSFGWDVFNEDTLYKSYNKRAKTIPSVGPSKAKT